jgi:hypothetical protein
VNKLFFKMIAMFFLFVFAASMSAGTLGAKARRGLTRKMILPYSISAGLGTLISALCTFNKPKGAEM